MKNIITSRLFLLTWVLLISSFVFSLSGRTEELPKETAKQQNSLFAADFQKAPTYIKSESMILFSEKRLVEYKKNVEVLHEDMRITCDRLEVHYTEKNEIEKIYAFDNVFITRENGTQARSEQAVYEKAAETITLTVNPEVQENGSIVTADTIRIFLEEDRSEAEGNVRVKLVEQPKKKDAAGTKAKELQTPSLSKIF